MELIPYSIGNDLILEVPITGKRTKEVQEVVKIPSYSHFFPTNLDVKQIATDMLNW